MSKLDVSMFQAEHSKSYIENSKSYKELELEEVKAPEQDGIQYYDVIIEPETMLGLLAPEGCLKIRYKDYDNYQELKKQKTTRFACIGPENTGKTFVAGKLVGKDLPHGYHLSTNGVSILYPPYHKGSSKNNLAQIHYVCIDTPGSGVPIRKQFFKKKLGDDLQGSNEADVFRKLLIDNRMTEEFQQQFVLENTDVLLIIINKLQRAD